MFLFHYAFVAVAWLTALMPFWLLYIKSDFLFLILYHVARYRKKVVFENLHNSFPEKTNKEIELIARKYYRNLADLILEIIKLRHLSKKVLMKRVKVNNGELLQNFYEQKKSVLVIMGHCGNWEWASIAGTYYTRHKCYGMVKPLSDPFFDKYMIYIRQRLNPDSIVHFKRFFRMMIEKRNMLTANLLAGDQTPTRSEINYWTTFLNQETAVFLGAEKIAKSLDMPVVFMDIQRCGRMRYDVTLSLITDNPKATADFEITEKHVRMLENAIRLHPENWLWSHRRWKHKRSDIESVADSQ
jgi:Kdo2-lipid IVA lauroyltransferase/acyltransferase